MTTNGSRHSGISRRSILKGVVAGTTLSAPFLIFPGKAKASEQLVVANWGGALAEVKKRVYYEPFTRETGIPIVAVSGPELAKVKAQVETKDVQWDVVDLSDSWIPVAEKLGLFEAIDTSIVNADIVPDFTRREFEWPTSFYLGGIGFATDRFSEAERPQMWSDFWDVEKFPGQRGLRKRIADTLEIALLADGVPPAEVYPCDIERAFKALDRIKPHIKQWVDSMPQTVSFIQNNECDFTFTYSSIVRLGAESGIPIDISKKNNLIGTSWVAVLKGTKMKDAAMRYVDFIMRTNVQLEYCDITGNPPITPEIVEKMTPEARKWVVDPMAPDNLVMKPDWWGPHLDDLNARFHEWILT